MVIHKVLYILTSFKEKENLNFSLILFIECLSLLAIGKKSMREEGELQRL